MKSRAKQLTTDQTLTRTDEIITLLKQEILGGQYRPGERLPSERDLSNRFATSRGTVREALKKLEQLGIASIQPGGARVVPVEKATLDILDSLLSQQDSPDPRLLDQVLEVIGVLMVLAAQSAIRYASDEQLQEAKAVAGELITVTGNGADQQTALRRLAYTFIEASEHLVLQLVFNGLQTQFIDQPDPPRAQRKLDDEPLREIIDHLQEALDNRDTDAATGAMTDLNRLIRAGARQSLATEWTEISKVNN